MTVITSSILILILYMLTLFILKIPKTNQVSPKINTNRYFHFRSAIVKTSYGSTNNGSTNNGSTNNGSTTLATTSGGKTSGAGIKPSHTTGSITSGSTAIPPLYLEKDCALLFFGLAKNFKEEVLPSIRKYILDVNPYCDIYAHTYNIHAVTNPRNEENNTSVYPLEVYFLTNNVALDTLESASKFIDFQYYHKFYLSNTVGFISMDNMIKEWYSVERVWNSTKPFHYKRLGLFRLDVQYQEPINISHGDAVVPNFQHFGLVNDRAFYGLRKYAKIWATTRFSQVEAQAKRNHNDLRAEAFLHYILRDVPYVMKPMCFWRVRAKKGVVLKEDCKAAALPVQTKETDHIFGNNLLNSLAIFLLLQIACIALVKCCHVYN